MSIRGRSNALSLCIAALSLLPFEIVAKGTILVSGAVFIFDPVPGGRVFALIAVLVVFLLSRLRNKTL